jgi:hypothetical protein
MSDAFVLMKGLCDRGRVRSLVLASDALMRMNDALVRMNDAFVRMSDVFVPMSDVFVRMSDVFVRMSDVFVRMSDVFVRISNAFVRTSASLVLTKDVMTVVVAGHGDLLSLKRKNPAVFGEAFFVFALYSQDTKSGYKTCQISLDKSACK